MEIDSKDEYEQILCELRSFLEDRYTTGESGVVIPKERVRVAITLIKNWPKEITIPYLDVDEGGEIQFYVFDESGLVTVAAEFYGEKHLCAYSIDKADGGSREGIFDANSNECRKNFYRELTQKSDN